MPCAGPPTSLIEHPHGLRNPCAGLKYAWDGNPARGPDGRENQHRPLDGHERRGHSSGLRLPSVGTMGDLGGRYGAYTARLVDRVLAAPGHTPAELRRAVLARAFGPHPL